MLGLDLLSCVRFNMYLLPRGYNVPFKINKGLI